MKKKLNALDRDLIEMARVLVGDKKVSGGVIKEAGSAILTKDKNIYTGVSLDLSCGIGFCAEHSAIAEMVTKSNETEIDTVVAHEGSKIIPPCGRCREMIHLLNKNNLNKTFIIISLNEKITLNNLLPNANI